MMNNSTRNFTNSSNTQNSSSLKDKLRKLTTGVALAGTLLMGTACENKTNTTADEQKDKTENGEVKADGKDILTDENTVAFTDIQEANKENDDLEYEKAILEINLELENQQIIKDSLKAVENSKKISEDTKRISENSEKIAENSEKIAENTRRIAKNRKNARAEMEALWASVDEEVFKSSKEVQDALNEYFQWAKENWYEPIPHVKYLASLKK